MSYNISNWKTKKCDLKMPLSMLVTDPLLKVRPCPEGIQMGGLSEGFAIIAHSEGDIAFTTDVCSWGVGSGRSWQDLLDILRQTTGEMEAIVIWEGGDSVQRLKIRNGEVSVEEVDF